MSFSIGFLILRVVVGLLLAGHGAQKLFGWFGGHGLAGTTGWLQSQGFKPARLWALLGAGGEFGGGLFLALGLLTPLAAIALFASMLMAVIKFHWKAGLWSTNNGYEYPLVLLFVSVFFGLAGGGDYSLDKLFNLTIPYAPIVFVVGVVLSFIVDAIGIATTKQKAVQATSAGQSA